MVIKRLSAVAVGTALLLGGCSFTNDALLPSLGVDANGNSDGRTATQQPGVSGQVASQPAQQPVVDAAGAPQMAPSGTGTFVGAKVTEIRGELGRLQTALQIESESLQALRASAAQNATVYHSTVADIATKLQIGSTAGNPILTQQWNTAQTQLQAVSNDLDKMNILANEMSGNVTFANYVLDSIHNAFGLAGAVEEDHRQLQQLEQMTYQASQQLQRLVGDLSGDISRQSAFLYAERNNLSTLALAINSGQPMGPAFSNTLSYMPAPAPAASLSGLAANRPLVTIRFDQPNVQYQQPLYQAVRVAMDRRPNAAFDLVAIPAAATTPSQQSANYAVARQYADQVMRSLIGMGVPVDRVSVRTASGQTTPSSEVRLYVR
ncbi:MAG: hypothetical protein U1E53_15005 [Dongiaceae bacterium]